MSVYNIENSVVKPEYIDRIIISHLEGTSSESDDLLLLEWISSSKENLEYFSEIKTVWYATGQYQSELSNLQNSVKTYRSKKKMVARVFYPAAAIALFLLISFVGYRSNVRNTIMIENANPKAERVILPDGTTIWLYEGSRLSYNAKRYNDKRNVKLSGEADFDVTSNRLHPFVLTCPKITVKVLGTVFNVKDFANEANAETTLAEGAIELSLNHSNNKVSVNEGQHVTYNQYTKDLKMEEVNTNRLSLRRLGIISMENVTINDIVFKLQNEFGKHVFIKDPNVDLKKRYIFNYPENAELKDIISLLEVITSSKIETE